MAASTSPASPPGNTKHNKPPPGNNNNNNHNNKLTSISSCASVTPAMLKAAKRFQEKLRKPKKGRRKKKQAQSEPKPLKTRSYKTQPLRKGKSYSSSSDREPRERNLAEHRERNYVFDTKIGARNSKTGFKLRKFYRLGSQKYTRRDRIYSVDSDSDHPDM